jgi:hypothetical protein
MAVVWRIGAGKHVGANEREAVAERVSAQQFQLQPALAGGGDILLKLAEQFGAVADADVAGLNIFDILTDQLLHLPPQQT